MTAAATTGLAAALVAFQKDAPKIAKDTENSFFNSKYASLDAIFDGIRTPLANQGLAISQLPCVLDTGMPGLRTILLHVSGERMEDVMPLAVEKPGPQAQGSALTYARRYAVLSVLGLVADEDDDGNTATPTKNEPAPPKAPQPPAKAKKASDLAPHQKRLYAKYKAAQEAGRVDEAGFKKMLADARAGQLLHVTEAQAKDIEAWLADTDIPF